MSAGNDRHCPLWLALLSLNLRVDNDFAPKIHTPRPLKIQASNLAHIGQQCPLTHACTLAFVKLYALAPYIAICGLLTVLHAPPGFLHHVV